MKWLNCYMWLYTNTNLLKGSGGLMDKVSAWQPWVMGSDPIYICPCPSALPKWNRGPSNCKQNKKKQ